MLEIGSKIKKLRKDRNLTQEQLAENIGISFQAVSKWENNIALPDITLVPRIAQVLGVTTDCLFSFSLKDMQDEITAICDKAYEFRESDPEKARQILEQGLEKHPENDILLNNLLYVINYSENPDETIKIAGKLADKTDMSDVRYDSLRFLAYAYNAKGDTESAVAALEQIPELYFSKLSEMAFVLSGKAKFEAAEKQKWISFETLLQMMWKMAECYEENGETEKAISETQEAVEMIEVLKNEKKISNFQSYKDFFNNQINRMKN